MGLLDASYSAVNTKKPRKSDRILPATELNARGLLDAATNVPIAGDALSGVLAAYDAAKGDYGSAAMNALGVLPFVSAGMVKGTGKIADAINPKKMTEYEKRHEIARQNAVKMLGLPENNTAMDRARAMGYTDEMYKGMYPYDWTKEVGSYTGPEITEIKRTTPFPSFGGTDGDVNGIAGFLSGNPQTASRFAGDSGAVYPLMYKKGREHLIDANGANAGKMQFGEDGFPFRDAVRSGDFDTVRIANTADEGNVIVALNPANIRSRFAAFDPMRRHEADLLGYADPYLLGGIGAGGLLGLGAYKANQE